MSVFHHWLSLLHYDVRPEREQQHTSKETINKTAQESLSILLLHISQSEKLSQIKTLISDSSLNTIHQKSEVFPTCTVVLRQRRCRRSGLSGWWRWKRTRWWNRLCAWAWRYSPAYSDLGSRLKCYLGTRGRQMDRERGGERDCQHTNTHLCLQSHTHTRPMLLRWKTSTFDCIAVVFLWLVYCCVKVICEVRMCFFSTFTDSVLYWAPALQVKHLVRPLLLKNELDSDTNTHISKQEQMWRNKGASSEASL